MSNAELIERLNKPCGRTTGHGESCSVGWLCGACADKAKAADALELADKRIAELAEEITMLRAQHLYTCGTTHPEMYKTELDYAKERIAELEGANHGLYEGTMRQATRIAELERKLAVAREALRYAGDEPNLDRARRIADAALAQIGGEDAR